MTRNWAVLSACTWQKKMRRFEHIQDEKALRCSDEELICPSCAEDLAVDEEDTPNYACSVCGDTQSERRYFFEGEYYCGNHFDQLFVNVEPDD